MQKISPFLWFDNQAEEAMLFYTGIFENSRPGSIMRCGDAGPGPKGSVLSTSFELAGQEFIALNGGPHVAFNHAVSFFVHCADQAEIDRYWNALSAGGAQEQCGWLRDKFGLSWQIVPTALGRMLRDPDADKAARVMRTMMNMRKLDLAQLQAAYDGEAA